MFNWRDYVDLAKDLKEKQAEGVSVEASQRSAVSRAYFGAYCYARNYAKSFLKFESRDDADDHGRLRNHLKGKRRKGDADRLEQLRQWRNDADYMNELPWSDRTAVVEIALEMANSVFSSLTPPSSK